MENTPWLHNDGEQVLKDIGVTSGDTVVDFGCGAGDYTIPAAKVVGDTGVVYAVNKNEKILNGLIQKTPLDNIIPVVSDTVTVIHTKSVNVVLLYDILHYGAEPERNHIYIEVFRMLKNDGILSVYPKHCKTDFPMGGLKNMDISDVIQEIEDNHFCFEGKLIMSMLHDHSYTTGVILQFTPKSV